MRSRHDVLAQAANAREALIRRTPMPIGNPGRTESAEQGVPVIPHMETLGVRRTDWQSART